MKSLCIVTSHPIQYQIPWFRALAARTDIDLEVLFCHDPVPREQGAAGFGIEFKWDRPLIGGYRHRFLRNVAARPGLGRFGGLDTPDVARAIASGQYSAVLVNGWHYKSAWQAIVACWRTRTPLLVRGDSHLHGARGLMRRVAREITHRWFIRRFDGCVAVGRWSAEYFRHYGAKSERVFVIPHTVDDEWFRTEAVRLAAERSAIRIQWELGLDSSVFLFAGKFVPTKRPLDYVRAIGRAARMGAPVDGLMVGDGPLKPECEALARQSNAPVRFVGFLNQSEIVRAYVAADALVLPSGGETWGLVVNEAMTCGRACLVSDRVGSGPDLVVPEHTGVVFPHGNVEMLSELLYRYGRNRLALEAMGEMAGRMALAQGSDVAAGRTVDAVSAVATP